jgi:aryl-alcohol dehydrogenase-like predicted oxidoreductase
MNKFISIPGTDLSLFSIGLGTVDAGLRWDGADADRVFDTYLDLGGNVIDSAHVYSDWVPGELARSERVVGDWLRHSGKRDKVILITKGGHPDMTIPEPDMFAHRCSRADMENDINDSLKKIRVDYIDIYFYHRDNPNQPVEDEIETMESFVSAGKIRYYGCSNWSAERMKAADAYCAEKGYRGFVADQSLLNVGMKYMNPMPDPSLAYTEGNAYQYHIDNPGNLMMPYMGVCSGFFYILKSDEAAASKSNYYTPGNLKVAKRLDELCEKYGCTLTQAILGFFYTQPFACLPLYGPFVPDSLSDAVGTFNFQFKKEDYEFDF